MKKSTIIILSIVGVLVLYGVICQRSLVSIKQEVLTSKSNIEVQYQRRNDLIPNLVNTVKAQSNNEKEIYTQIAELRSKLNTANKNKENLQANQEVSDSLSKLLVVVESYPNLKQNEGFENLRLELEGTENRIATARQNYNESVRAYNSKIKMFPTNIIANILNYKEDFQFIKASAEAQKVPNVKF
ncbi:TPA: LemA family protein [Clostridium botulinum]|nr:LemA family protein [Clostridium botulinum]